MWVVRPQLPDQVVTIPAALIQNVHGNSGSLLPGGAVQARLFLQMPGHRTRTARKTMCTSSLVDKCPFLQYYFDFLHHDNRQGTTNKISQQGECYGQKDLDNR